VPAHLAAQLPKAFELVGLGYTAWFTYRYLLFKSSREELVEDIESLKKKIRLARACFVWVHFFVSGCCGLLWVFFCVLAPSCVACMCRCVACKYECVRVRSCRVAVQGGAARSAVPPSTVCAPLPLQLLSAARRAPPDVQRRAVGWNACAY
jgi:hypothetical protein